MITMIKKDGTSEEITPSTSVNTEEVAAPSVDSTNTGANAQETADPAPTSDDSMTTIQDVETTDDGAESILDAHPEKAPAKQDTETNSRYAAARRAAEKQRDDAVAEAERKATAKVESFIRSMNLKGPDGKLISTEEEYAAYTAARTGHNASANIAEQTGMSAEKVNDLVSAHPDVQAAAREHDALARERAQHALDEEVGKVHEAFPEINSVDDIIKLVRYPDIKDKVSRGYSLSDAVNLVYSDVYHKRISAAAAQQARNAAASTAHLSATRTHGSGGINVTESQIRTYMDAIPGSTREQAIAAYRKHKISK